jgi:hypothetical protein
MRRSTFIPLILSALLAACGSGRSSPDLSPATPTPSLTPTAVPASINIELLELCGGRGVNSDVRYTIRLTDYEGPDVTVVDRTFENNRETQRILLDSGPEFENAVAFLTDGHDGEVGTEVMSKNGGCSGRKSELSFLTQKPPAGATASTSPAMKSPQSSCAWMKFSLSLPAATRMKTASGPISRYAAN